MESSEMRLLKSPALWVILLAGSLAALANVGGDSSMHSNSLMASDRPSLTQMSKEESTLREGAMLADIKGRFKKQGERFVFTEEATNKSYKCLENICLQRIALSQQDDDRKVFWLVSAKITEFNNENFLLVEKSVRSR
jgi:hypothetical protein